MRVRTLFFLIIIIAGVIYGLSRPDVRAHLSVLWAQVRHDSMGEGSRTLANEPKVFVPRNDPYYHRKGCPRMEGKTPVPMPLSKAKAIAQPCPECRPPQ